jgi:hypothetical protein
MGALKEEKLRPQYGSASAYYQTPRAILHYSISQDG